MCLELDLDSITLYLISKRSDASRSQLTVVINPQTLAGKLQDLQEGGRLEAVHCRKTYLGRKVLNWPVLLTDCGKNYFVEGHARERVTFNTLFSSS